MLYCKWQGGLWLHKYLLLAFAFTLILSFAKISAMLPATTPPFPDKKLNIPNNGLCLHCKPQGRCLASFSQLTPTKLYLPQDYLDMVPLHVVNAGMVRCNKAGKLHLQNAYDAFHQQDYETAMLQFHTVLEESATVEEALIGLAIAYYFMGDFENANRYMMYYGDIKLFQPATDIVNSFQDLCIQGTALKSPKELPTAADELVYDDDMIEEYIIALAD